MDKWFYDHLPFGGLIIKIAQNMDDAPKVPKFLIQTLSKTKINELNKKLLDKLTLKFMNNA